MIIRSFLEVFSWNKQVTVMDSFFLHFSGFVLPAFAFALMFGRVHSSPFTAIFLGDGGFRDGIPNFQHGCCGNL